MYPNIEQYEERCADRTSVGTGKVIKAIVVGKCTDCTGDNILLTTDGLAALSPGEIEANVLSEGCS